MLTAIALLLTAQVHVFSNGQYVQQVDRINFTGQTHCSLSGRMAVCATDAGTGGGGGGAPTTAKYVTTSSDATLTDEKVLGNGNYTVLTTGLSTAQIDWQHGLSCSVGNALTTDSTSTLKCTATITANNLACASDCVADSEITDVAPSKLTAVVPANKGGLGATQPTCGGGQFLTCNGTTCSCGTPSGSGGGPSVHIISLGRL